MSASPIVVLKFGGSVLLEDDCVNKVLNNIYSFVRDGRKVIAVVSAFGNLTDELTSRARKISSSPEPEAFASLLATGELVSASMLSLAADDAGIESQVLGYERLGIRTIGESIDAEPVSVDFEEWDELFRKTSLVVVPGFIGLSPGGSTTLLGRGGSDLTALYLAAKTKAERCVLYKDVGGWFEEDPNIYPSTKLYRTLNWDDAVAANVDIVQPKAVRYSAKLKQPFEVAGLRTGDGTVVGPQPTHAIPNDVLDRRIPVVIAGAGTVGVGVYEYLKLWNDVFSIEKVLVRDVDKDRGIPQDLLTTDPVELANIDNAVLIECTGDLDVGNYLVTAALLKGRHVVTAGKELVARHGARLAGLAEARQCIFKYSAAVGGAVPMLELVDADAEKVTSIRGIVNGTCNFVLDEVRNGKSFTEAVKSAQENGYAEADPAGDLSGLDAVYKISLLAQKAFGAWTDPADIPCTGIDNLKYGMDSMVRLVATAQRSDDGSYTLRVQPEVLSADDPLHDVAGVSNSIVIDLSDGRQKIVRGKGAGRKPTALSIFGDLLDISKQNKQSKGWNQQEAA